MNNELAEKLSVYSDIVCEHGYNHPEANAFYKRHCHDSEFAELADEVRRLEIQFRQPQYRKKPPNETAAWVFMVFVIAACGCLALYMVYDKWVG